MPYRSINDPGRQRLLRGVVLLIVFGLCGTFDILNNNFARWATPLASFPEEEEFHAKDRSALVTAVQPSRRGAVRPTVRPAEGTAARKSQLRHSSSQLTRLPAARATLTGAGIFQHC